MKEYQNMRQPTTHIMKNKHGTTSKKSHQALKFLIGFKLRLAYRRIK